MQYGTMHAWYIAGSDSKGYSLYKDQYGRITKVSKVFSEILGEYNEIIISSNDAYMEGCTWAKKNGAIYLGIVVKYLDTIHTS